MQSDVDEIDAGIVLNHIQESLIIVNTDARIIYFNNEAERLASSLKKKMQFGIPIADFLPAERKKAILQVLNFVIAEKISQVRESEYKNGYGHSVFYEETFYPITSRDKIVQHVCIVFREITAQKSFEKKANQLVRDFSGLIENANAIIFGIDSRGYITDWNSECVRVTAINKREVFAKKINQIIDHRSEADFEALLKKVIEGFSVSNFECLLKTQNNPITALVNGTPKKNANGEVIGALFVGQDISELINYRTSLEEKVNDRTEQLKEALKKEKELLDVKDKFIAIASHEFKMPLASISSSVHSLQEVDSFAETEKAKLLNIEKQVGHMRALLENILTIEKNEVKRIKPNYTRIDLVSFLKKLGHEVSLATQNTHRIKSNYPHPVVEIESDEKLLRNIFLNLFSNAIKYSPMRKEIFVSVFLQTGRVLIKVRDEGIGIANDDKARIFEAFNRGSNAGEITGSGLGLLIVRKAVEILSGELAVDSLLGVGTTITVQLNVTAKHKD
jgi:PAS domain S-box-containing protein